MDNLLSYAFKFLHTELDILAFSGSYNIILFAFV